MSLDCLKMDEASALQRVDTQIECLPDEILVEILSHMSLKGAGRTSVLSRRWRYLWRFVFGSLCFDLKDDDDDYDPYATDDDPRTAAMVSEKFRGWVNRVLELHHAPQLDKFVVHFRCPKADLRADEVDRWVDFAMRKEVKEFKLRLVATCEGRSWYEFPNREKYAFGRLRSLRLEFVNVKDEVVHNILASCPYLETLLITGSACTRNLQVLDPSGNLKHLEIVYCCGIQSIGVSATSLVSFTYVGHQPDKSLFKNTPNLSEVNLDGGYASSFIYEGDRHSSYSAQLVKIALRIKVNQRPNHLALPRLDSLKQLELHIRLQIGESLLFFILLTKAAPLLCQFEIMLDYITYPQESKRLESSRAYLSFPEVHAAELTTFYHENLKLVGLTDYIGCPSEEKFLEQLCKMAPSLEKVIVYTFGFYSEPFNEPEPYHKLIVKETGASTRVEAVERAKNLKLGAGDNMIMSSTETMVIWQVETRRKTLNEPAQNTDLNTSYVPRIENANQTNSPESKSTHKPQLQALSSAIFKFSVMILGFWVVKRHFRPSKKAKD